MLIGLEGFQRWCPCGVNRAISKMALSTCSAARRLPPRLQIKDVSSHRPFRHRRQHALRSGRTTRWWCQSNLLPKTCARRTCTSETLRARTMNHRRSTKTSSRCPEWSRGSRDATPRRAHPPFSSTYISALCAAVNARTNVGSAAAPAHDPMGPHDARRRQEITYSRSTGPLCAELGLGRPLVPL